ncbi:MAG: phosphoenolpyruvate carboxylase, partial [Gammaproteobacteria bacterium]|nr:phosphoenolpyruvate carboxylase [Gammaproteobacteria bacterium]NIR96345.1 phosphoenolpyruvate carboxylase [Gammaproteobacteria bacterium]NIW47977.1 hypothetical protein [Gammaproteobacteria bacterium]
ALCSNILEADAVYDAILTEYERTVHSVLEVGKLKNLMAENQQLALSL